MDDSEIKSGCEFHGSAPFKLPKMKSEQAGVCPTQSMGKTYDTVFLNAKAGMEGVDKSKVQKVVYEMSKGSKFFSNEQRKEAIEKQRIEVMMARVARLTQTEIAEHEKATDSKLIKLEATRDLSRVWMHVDMDAFYAAVETLADPSLAGKAVAVGGQSMICTANYEARKFGVRAAMPGFIARKLCPELVFVKPDFKKYTHFCELSREVFREYDPHYIARSLDEAYLDITESCRLRNMSAAEVAEELRSKVYSATGLTCSAGVGPNWLLAKVCSDINKPNGQYILENERSAVVEFIASLPIRKVPGIGKVTERMLREVLGIKVCSDLLTKRAYISALFSQTSTDFFLSVGLGIGATEAPQHEQRKSLGHERTFSALSNKKDLYQKLDELAELVARDLVKEGLKGRTVTLKLKTTGFEVRTRAVTLPWFTNSKTEIMLAASKLLKAELPVSLRLMGLRINHFKLTIPEPAEHSQKTITSFISKSARPLSGGVWDDDHSLYHLDGSRMKPEDYLDEFQDLESSESDELHEQLLLAETAVLGADGIKSEPPHKSECIFEEDVGLTRLYSRPGPSVKRKRRSGQQTLRTFLSSANRVTDMTCAEETSKLSSASPRLEVEHSVSQRQSPSGDPIIEEEHGTGPVHDADLKDQLLHGNLTPLPKKDGSSPQMQSGPSCLSIREVEQQATKIQGHRRKRRSDTTLEHFFAREKQSAIAHEEKG